MDKLIIIGSAPCVLIDLSAIPDHARFDFMLIGSGSPATLNIRHLAYHASHENDFDAIRKRRKSNGLNIDFETFSNNPHPGVDHVFPELTAPVCPKDCRPPKFGPKDPRNHHHYSGSSALLGAQAALKLGYCPSPRIQEDNPGGSAAERGSLCSFPDWLDMDRRSAEMLSGPFHERLHSRTLGRANGGMAE